MHVIIVPVPIYCQTNILHHGNVMLRAVTASETVGLMFRFWSQQKRTIRVAATRCRVALSVTAVQASMYDTGGDGCGPDCMMCVQCTTKGFV